MSAQQKIYHRADKINANGRVSALCFKSPRPIVLSKALWTIRDEAVTCPKCRVILAAKGAIVNPIDPMEIELPPLPKLDPKDSIPYESIRYINGFAESTVHRLMQDYARAAIQADRISRVPSGWYESMAELAAVYGEMCEINKTLDKDKTPDQFARLATLRAECVAIHYKRIALLATSTSTAALDAQNSPSVSDNASCTLQVSDKGSTAIPAELHLPREHLSMSKFASREDYDRAVQRATETATPREKP